MSNTLNGHDDTVTQNNENDAELVDNMDSVDGQEGIIHSEESVSNLSPEHDVSNTPNGHDDTVTQNNENDAESVDDIDSVTGQEGNNLSEESVSNLTPEHTLNEHDGIVTQDNENDAELDSDMHSVAGQEGINQIYHENDKERSEKYPEVTVSDALLRGSIPTCGSSSDAPREVMNRSHLPTEILGMIFKQCVKSDPSQMFILMEVSEQFRDIVERLFPLPEIYLDSSIFPDVPRDTPISVRRLISLYGRYSGVGIEIRRIINNNKWHYAWLKITECENRWFRITSIFWRSRSDRQ